MTSYAVIWRSDWDDREDISTDSRAIRVANVVELQLVVDAMTRRGSVLTIPSVARKIRDGHRTYIAGSRGQQGVLVQQVPAQSLTNDGTHGRLQS
jgi:hypothetical protein